MAYILYLLNRNPSYYPTTYKGSWGDTTVMGGGDALDSTKAGGGPFTSRAKGETSATLFTVGLLRVIGPKMAAQTISGTLDFVLGCKQDHADADYSWCVHAYVTQEDTDVIRGTLLANYRESLSGNEWPTVAVGRGLAAPQTLTSVDVLDGDRMVIEFGFVANNTHTTS